jgi:hypothetical protein
MNATHGSCAMTGAPAHATGLRDPLAWSRRVNLLEQQGRIAEAERVWRDALAEGGPFTRFARYRLVVLLERTGRLAEAEHVWRDAVAAGDSAARIHLAVLMEQQGRRAEAEAIP